MESILDITLAKIAFQAGILIHSTVSEEQKKSEQAAKIMKLNLKKKEGAAFREAIVYDAFYNIRKSPGEYLNKIVERIYSFIKKKENSRPPSKITIRRAFIE